MMQLINYHVMCTDGNEGVGRLWDSIPASASTATRKGSSSINIVCFNSFPCRVPGARNTVGGSD